MAESIARAGGTKAGGQSDTVPDRNIVSDPSPGGMGTREGVDPPPGR